MLINILHQLHSNDIVNYFLQWIRNFLDEYVFVFKRFVNEKILANEIVANRLKRRFQLVTTFIELKHFNYFSEIKQWTSNEQKLILYQLVPIVTSLLTLIALYAMLCVRVFLNFVMLTHYRSHDHQTLEYINYALYRINKLKNVFREFRVNKRN
jgi:hypothetical protein